MPVNFDRSLRKAVYKHLVPLQYISVIIVLLTCHASASYRSVFKLEKAEENKIFLVSKFLIGIKLGTGKQKWQLF